MIKRIINKSKAVFTKALNNGISEHNFAAACAFGIYIAFFPLPGTHLLLVGLAQWIFRLNIPIVVLVSCINNPWTMIPFFTADYYVGYWLIHDLLGYNPSWTFSLTDIFGSGSICVWSFFVGGNLLGIVGALLMYPIALTIFKRIKQQNNPTL